MLKDKSLHYDEYMRKALNYIVNGWKNLLSYRRNDGRYMIDYMLAERAARPFMVNRKSSMIFSSEKGAEGVMALYTIVGR